MPLAGFTPYKKDDADKYNKFRWWPGITFGDMLDKAAGMYPDKEALVDNTSRLTYSQVREKAKEILGTHEVPPLPDDVDREISKILLAAEKEKRKK